MPSPEWLVVGLGNPGPEYETTPHNLGFLTIDRVAARNNIRVTRPEANAWVGLGKIRDKDVVLAKPQTFMNRSGGSVRLLLEKYELKPESLLLVFDELALPWGNLRVRPDGSAGGHNGIADVIRAVGTQKFPRLRFGIHPGRPYGDGARYVLAPIQSELKKDLDTLLDRSAEAVESIIAEGVSKAMAAYNRRAPGSTKEDE